MHICLTIVNVAIPKKQKHNYNTIKKHYLFYKDYSTNTYNLY